MRDQSILGLDMVCISKETFHRYESDFLKGNMDRCFHATVLASVTLDFTQLYRIVGLETDACSRTSSCVSQSQSCFAEHILTDEVAAQRLVAHACELASEQPNHNPQPAYKIPAVNAERMISTRKSVFLVNSSDARQNGSEHVQKPYYNQSVIRNYMESSRPL